ncbi:LLM class flavin-dependent oxidoreductase [Plantactinospora sp. DSM 117369]
MQRTSRPALTAPFYEAFTTLAWLAAHTHSIELGPSVAVVPQRHPLQLARVTATLDQLSGGRLILGVGIGWATDAFDALGIPFSRRGKLTDECLLALRELWTTDLASFHGETVYFDNVHPASRPARVPHPPIWIGGNSPAALVASRDLRPRRPERPHPPGPGHAAWAPVETGSAPCPVPHHDGHARASPRSGSAPRRATALRLPPGRRRTPLQHGARPLGTPTGWRRSKWPVRQRRGAAPAWSRSRPPARQGRGGRRDSRG